MLLQWRIDAWFQLDELGQLLCNICQITPGGVVCFVASYSFAAFVRDYFTASGVTERLQKRKKVAGVQCAQYGHEHSEVWPS